MALTQITYNNKSDYQSSSLANEYKVTASDMNEIKTVVNGAVDSATYSTTETPVGTWIDGKTIYRRVFSGNLDTTNVNIGTISDYETITKIDGMVNYTAIDQWFPISTQGAFTAQVKEGDVLIRLSGGGAGWTGQPVKVIVEYTKTS